MPVKRKLLYVCLITFALFAVYKSMVWAPSVPVEVFWYDGNVYGVQIHTTLNKEELTQHLLDSLSPYLIKEN